MNWQEAVEKTDAMVTVTRAIVSGALDGVVPALTDELKENFERITTSEAIVMVEAGEAVLKYQAQRIAKAQRLYRLHDNIHEYADSIVKEAQEISDTEVDFDYHTEPTELTSDFDRAEEDGEYIEKLDADAFDTGSLESNVENLNDAVGQYSDLVRSINEILDSERRAGDLYVRLRKNFMAQYNEAWRQLVNAIVNR